MRRRGSITPPPVPTPAAVAPRRAGGRLIETRLAYAAVTFSLAILGFCVWKQWLFPPEGTDSLIYHLTIPAFWLQNGFLSTPDIVFHDGVCQHSPLLFEVLAYALMRFTGDDGLVNLIQPLFFLLTILVFHASIRLLGATRTMALLLTAVFILFPPFLMDSRIANNDLVLTCGTALMLYALLLFHLRPRAALLAAGAGVGVSLAAKVVGIIFVAAWLPLFLVTLWREWPERRARGRQLWPWAVAGAVLALAGSGFLLRNLVCYGNPLYPSRVAVLGWQIFAGGLDLSIFRDHRWSWRALSLMLFNDDQSLFALRLPLSFMLWVLALLALALRFPRCCARVHWRSLAAGVLFVLVGAGLYFAVVPFWSEHRLLFPVYYGLCLGATCGVACLQRLLVRVGEVRTLPLVVLMLYLLQLCLGNLTSVPVARLGVLLATGAAFVPWPRRTLRRCLLPAAAVVVLAAVVLSPGWYPAFQEARVKVRPGRFTLHYGALGNAWAVVDRICAEQGPQTIAYAGTPIIYPLFGPRFQNRVVYVPVGPGDRPGPVRFVPGEPEFVSVARARRTGAVPAFWLAGLETRRVTLLFLDTGDGCGGTGPDLEAIRRFPDRFSEAYRDGRVVIYRVLAQ